MLASITPLGERGRNSRWWLTTSFYVFGSTLAGLLFGGLLGGLGAGLTHTLSDVAGWVPLGVLAGAVAIGLTLDLRLGGLRLPTIHRQVKQAWLTRYRGWVYGLGFGFQLGLGVVTVVTTSAVYTTLLAAFLSGSARRGVIVGGAFGLLRAASVLSVARLREERQLDALEPRLRRWEPRSKYAAVALQVGVMVTTIVSTI